jgi:putative oxidoreductase
LRKPPGAAGNYLAPWGLPATSGWATTIGSLELVGGAMLALGLLTRPVALLLAIELFFVTFIAPQNLTLAWIMKGAAEHYALTIFVVCLAFVFRGGGRWSLDRKIGREF